MAPLLRRNIGHARTLTTVYASRPAPPGPRVLRHPSAPGAGAGGPAAAFRCALRSCTG